MSPTEDVAMPPPPERFARSLPASIDLTDAQLDELRQIEQLANANGGAAVAAWNGFLARHGIDPPQRPASGTGATPPDRLTALRDECRRAAMLGQRVTRAGLRADWYMLVRKLYDKALEAAPPGQVPPPCPARIEDEVAGRQAIAVLLEWLTDAAASAQPAAVTPAPAPVPAPAPLVTTEAQPASPTPTETPPTRRPRGTVGQRILEVLQCELDSPNWSQRRWANYLSCGVSTVAESPAWQSVLRARAYARAAQVSSHEQPGHRRGHRRKGRKRSDE
jgi:hypothetical protein